MENKLESETVILESATSLTGATKRINKKLNTIEKKWLKITLQILILPGIWLVLLTYNFVALVLFGWLMIIIRLFRRSKRKDKVRALQHKELLEKLNEGK